MIESSSIVNTATLKIKKSTLKRRKADLVKKTTPSHKKALKIVREIALLFSYSVEKERILKPYILDIYIKDIKVGIEIDGAVHKETSGYDNRRDEFLLKTHRVKMFRFTNEDVKSKYFTAAVWDILMSGFNKKLFKIREAALSDGMSEFQFDEFIKLQLLF